jgi:hypothetical protein
MSLSESAMAAGKRDPFRFLTRIFGFPLTPLGSGRVVRRRATEETDELYKTRLRKLDPPSSMARNFRQSENDPVILHHRPSSACGIPTELLHSVFGKFLDDCKASPTADDVRFTLTLSGAMSEYFIVKEDRARCFRELLAGYLGISIKGVEIGGTITDGSWIIGPENYLGMNIEVKNEPGHNGDPYIQNIAYYKEYLLEASQIATKRLPCFLISLTGPNFGISNVIYGDKITADMYPCTLRFPSHYYHIEPFANILGALRKAIQNLDEYYRAIPLIEQGQREYPYFDSFTSSDGNLVRFKYHERLVSYSFIFIVDVEDATELPQQLLVKFTRNYGEEAHRACMKLGIAPSLYACQDLAGGWKAVVMAYEGDDFTMLSECELGAEDKVAAKAATMEAAKKMHDKRFVHGDLRNSNVLCRKTDSELKILFIDWDWAGKARDTIKYPTTINTDIHRHRDAKPGSPILQAHDEYMLGIMFS